MGNQNRIRSYQLTKPYSQSKAMNKVITFWYSWRGALVQAGNLRCTQVPIIAANRRTACCTIPSLASASVSIKISSHMRSSIYFQVSELKTPRKTSNMLNDGEGMLQNDCSVSKTKPHRKNSATYRNANSKTSYSNYCPSDQDYIQIAQGAWIDNMQPFALRGFCSKAIIFRQVL